MRDGAQSAKIAGHTTGAVTQNRLCKPGPAAAAGAEGTASERTGRGREEGGESEEMRGRDGWREEGREERNVERRRRWRVNSEGWSEREAGGVEVAVLPPCGLHGIASDTRQGRRVGAVTSDPPAEP